MSNSFWECSVLTAIHVCNKAPSRASNYLSPHEYLYNEQPDITYLCIFGCLAYAHTTTTQTKFDPTSQKHILMGYDMSTKEYKLWDPISHKLTISTDVSFEESVDPLQSPKPQPVPYIVNTALPDSDDEDDTNLTPFIHFQNHCHSQRHQLTCHQLCW